MTQEDQRTPGSAETHTPMRRIYVRGDWGRGKWRAYTFGDFWNGFATPFFEKAVADQVMQEVNQSWRETNEPPPHDAMTYDAALDTYRYDIPDNDYVDQFVGRDLMTIDGVRHLYAIGAWAWTWQKVSR